MQALEDFKILDLTRAGPGPYCTMILGDLGAEVIKIEAPPSASERQVGTFHSPSGKEGEKRAAYNSLHRNKKGVALDLKAPAGRQIFLQLAETADVIVEGFRPGVVQRLGIDYPAVSRINPRIVYCSITGYGQDGPYSGLSGHDINYTGMGGALSMIGEAERPVIPLNVVADFGGGGTNAAIGILSALIARNKTGKGQFIDISLTDSVISLLSMLTQNYFLHNMPPKRQSVWVNGGYPYYNIYQTRDGGFITLGCLESWLWEKFCRAIGREDFIPIQPDVVGQFVYPPQGSQWQEVAAYLKQVFLTRTRDEWFEFLSEQDVPVGKVYSLDEVFADPQILHRQMVIEVEHPEFGKVKQVGMAIKLSDTPGKVRSTAPTMGQHTEEVLLSLGYDKAAIDNLRQTGIIG